MKSSSTKNSDGLKLATKIEKSEGKPKIVILSAFNEKLEQIKESYKEKVDLFISKTDKKYREKGLFIQQLKDKEIIS